MTGIEKRSVTIRGHRTSVSLEPAFMAEIERIAGERGVTLAALVASVDESRAEGTNLSSALRLLVLETLRQR